MRAENGRVNVKEVRAFGIWHLLASFFIHQKPLSFVLTLFVWNFLRNQTECVGFSSRRERERERERRQVKGRESGCVVPFEIFDQIETTWIFSECSHVNVFVFVFEFVFLLIFGEDVSGCTGKEEGLHVWDLEGVIRTCERSIFVPSRSFVSLQNYGLWVKGLLFFLVYHYPLVVTITNQ